MPRMPSHENDGRRSHSTGVGSNSSSFEPDRGAPRTAAPSLLDDALERTEARLVNCIHDELVLEVPQESAEHITPILEQVMCEGFLQMFPDAVAMTADLVEARTGRDWQEAK